MPKEIQKFEQSVCWPSDKITEYILDEREGFELATLAVNLSPIAIARREHPASPIGSCQLRYHLPWVVFLLAAHT